MAIDERELTAKERKKREKQERARARRKAGKLQKAVVSYMKPIEDWDAEELARGRPKAEDGTFRGRPPSWISASVHEEAIKRFTDLTQADMRGLVPIALETIKDLMTNTDEDEKGRPVVPPAVRMQASQWVVEHLVGKPKQRLEADISVKLQGILAQVMVDPNQVPGAVPHQLSGSALELESWEADEDLDDGDLEGED